MVSLRYYYSHKRFYVGLPELPKTKYGERYIFVGDEKSVEVETIGHFKLLLGTGLYLNLKDTFIVPSFRQNLVSVSLLDKLVYQCSFGNSQFNLSLNSNIVGTGH